MIETAVFLMQIVSAMVIVAGGVLTVTYVMECDGVTTFDDLGANDFEIDFRRVLAFARLPVHR